MVVAWLAGTTHSLTAATTAGLDRLDAVERDEAGEQDDRDEEVHQRAAEHDDDLLRHGQLVEDAVLVARLDLLQASLARLVDQLAEPAGAGDPQRRPRRSPGRGGNMPIIRM